jgi:hypothetical protein
MVFINDSPAHITYRYLLEGKGCGAVENYITIRNSDFVSKTL